MKYTILILFYFIFSLEFVFSVIDTIDYRTSVECDGSETKKCCLPSWSNTRNVEGNCRFPGNYQAPSNINVGAFTITLGPGVHMDHDLGTSSVINFTSGKIVFSANSKIQNATYEKYYIKVFHKNGSFTQCPSGTNILKNNVSGFLGSTSTELPAGTGNYFFCAAP